VREGGGEGGSLVGLWRIGARPCHRTEHLSPEQCETSCPRIWSIIASPRHGTITSPDEGNLSGTLIPAHPSTRRCATEPKLDLKSLLKSNFVDTELDNYVQSLSRRSRHLALLLSITPKVKKAKASVNERVSPALGRSLNVSACSKQASSAAEAALTRIANPRCRCPRWNGCRHRGSAIPLADFSSFVRHWRTSAPSSEGRVGTS
jgi:hypothetical protein